MSRLTDVEKLKVEKAIKHFEGLQKRYATTHNGALCEHVKMALNGLYLLLQYPDVVRCAECQYSHETRLKDPRLLDCEKNGLVLDHGYCNYGKRSNM